METPDSTHELHQPESGAWRRYRRPFHDVRTGEDAYEIRVLLPGVTKENVHVSLDGNHLGIEGVRQHRPDPSWRPILNELSWDDYRLNLELNVPVDADAISAHVEDGILQLTLPKSEKAKPRLIEVN